MRMASNVSRTAVTTEGLPKRWMATLADCVLRTRSTEGSWRCLLWSRRLIAAESLISATAIARRVRRQEITPELPMSSTIGSSEGFLVLAQYLNIHAAGIARSSGAAASDSATRMTCPCRKLQRPPTKRACNDTLRPIPRTVTSQLATLKPYRYALLPNELHSEFAHSRAGAVAQENASDCAEPLTLSSN
jgi:hypothetical protein